MRIAITSQDKESDFQFTNTSPWRAFYSSIYSFGHEVVSVNDNFDVVIFMNHHQRLLNKINACQRNVRKILVIWESPVTKPKMFDLENLRHYDLIFSPSKAWQFGDKTRTFSWPQGFCADEFSNTTDFKKRDSLPVVFQNNKFSLAEGELYSLRRNIIKTFGDKLVVFGGGWNNPLTTIKSLLGAIKTHGLWDLLRSPYKIANAFIKVQNYQGLTHDKAVMLKKFKYTIVIENSQEYISEKLFEALVAGCCVLYVGPRLEDYGIPNVAIQCPPNTIAIKEKYIELLHDQRKVSEVLVCARNYLSSSHFQGMNNTIVLRKLAEDICTEINSLGNL
jgi:hypothetical protein